MAAIPRNAPCVPLYDGNGQPSDDKHPINKEKQHSDHPEKVANATSTSFTFPVPPNTGKLTNEQSNTYYDHFFVTPPIVPDTARLTLGQTMEQRFLHFARDVDKLNTPFIVGQQLMEEVWKDLYTKRLEKARQEDHMNEYQFQDAQDAVNLKIYSAWPTNDVSYRIKKYWVKKCALAKTYGIKYRVRTYHYKMNKILKAERKAKERSDREIRETNSGKWADIAEHCAKRDQLLEEIGRAREEEEKKFGIPDDVEW